MGSGSNVVSEGGETENCVEREFSYKIIRGVAYSSDRDDRCKTPRLLPAYKTLQRLVDELLANNALSFDQMINQLGVTTLHGVEGHKTFFSIADMMLADGEINWGRIVALFAFSAHIAKHCYAKDGGSKSHVDDVAQYLAEYINDNLSARIRTSLGGWESITEKFPEKQNFESLIWKGLLGTVVSLGICSLAIIASK